MRDPATSAASLSVDAFGQLLAQAQGQLYGFARGLLHDSEEAHDVVQENFADAWRLRQRGAAPFDGASDWRSMRRWLFHAAYCEAITVARHRKVLVMELLDVADTSDYGETMSPQPFEDQVMEADVLRTVLASLSTADAACLLLNVVQGFTSAEIAQIADIAPEAAKKRLSRAKDRLRREYFAQQALEMEHER